MKALVLAAGYGTRLGSLTENTPKPLLPVGKQPLINHILDRIKDVEGLNEIIVVTNNKFYSHFDQWAQEQSDFKQKITVVNDGTNSNEDRLGSIGDISYVLKNTTVEDDLLVIGGDNLFDFNLKEYFEFAGSHGGSVTIGLYDIGDLELAKQMGVVAIDGNGQISSFEEKPQEPKSTLIAMCFYYLPKATLGLVSRYIEESGKSDKAGEYIRWLTQENDVYGFKFTGKWYDIGGMESYEEAQQQFS